MRLAGLNTIMCAHVFSVTNNSYRATTTLTKKACSVYYVGLVVAHVQAKWLHIIYIVKIILFYYRLVIAADIILAKLKFGETTSEEARVTPCTPRRQAERKGLECDGS